MTRSFARPSWLVVTALLALFQLHCQGDTSLDKASTDTVGMNTTVTDSSNTSPSSSTNTNSDIKDLDNLKPKSKGRLPAKPRMLRLTKSQYHNAISRTFGLSEPQDLDPDESSEPFLSIGASKVGTSPVGVEKYRSAALNIAQSVMQNKARHDVLKSCAPQNERDPCFADVTNHYGRLLWRRSLSADETKQYAEIPTKAATQLGRALTPQESELALTYLLAGLLSSPNFLYIPFVGTPIPDSENAQYIGIELASRLAIVLWDGPPDDALIQAAENGDLNSTAGLEATIDRMLKDPKARGVASRFLGEHWHIAKLNLASKSKDAFPKWDEPTLEAYKLEFELVVDDLVFERDGDIRELFTGKTTQVNALLADLYGVTPPEGDGFESRPLPEGRSGLLTSGAVISANSKAGRTSPTIRGVFVLENLLCEHAPPPPPSVSDDLDDSLMVDGRQSTVREQLEQHAKDPSCAGCHALFDPMGLSMENFDGIGIWRTMEQGIPIDTRGSFGGTTFENAQDLAKFLHDDTRTARCMAEAFYSFATNHKVARDEQGLIDDVADAYVAKNHSFLSLIKAVLLSPGFRIMRPADQMEPEPMPKPDPTPDPDPMPMNTKYAQDFDAAEQGDQPEGWTDTGADNAMTVDDTLFFIGSVGGGFSLTTRSEAFNIHSHYTKDGADSWKDYEFQGRMLRSELKGGVGVTVLSDYPNSDHYYRLRSYGDTPFHISPHGTDVLGDCTTDVTPELNQWYQFRLQAQDQNGGTLLKAKVWLQGQPEPDGWQIDNCTDNSNTRRSSGTFGTWSMLGTNAWDDLQILPIQ